MNYLYAFAAGVLVGTIYALIRVKAPAPPIPALFGLFGMCLVFTTLSALP